jgi:phage terminase large subunit-like protein
MTFIEGELSPIIEGTRPFSKRPPLDFIFHGVMMTLIER